MEQIARQRHIFGRLEHTGGLSDICLEKSRSRPEHRCEVRDAENNTVKRVSKNAVCVLQVRWAAIPNASIARMRQHSGSGEGTRLSDLARGSVAEARRTAPEFRTERTVKMAPAAIADRGCDRLDRQI